MMCQTKGVQRGMSQSAPKEDSHCCKHFLSLHATFNVSTITIGHLHRPPLKANVVPVAFERSHLYHIFTEITHQALRYIRASKLISSLWNKLVKPRFTMKKLKVADIAEGLSNVKQYLNIFGYLNSTLHANFSDNFTLDLQSEIVDFQKNFHLNVTGQIDLDTYKMISKPRCGVPDVVNTTPFTPWWEPRRRDLTYAVHPRNTVSNGVRVLLGDVFARWSNATSLRFSETAWFDSADVRVSFVVIDGEGGMVGGGYVNYSGWFGSVYLDSEEEWVVRGESDEGDVDLESLVMHVVGHVLGLGHSFVEEAVMFPIVLSEEKKKTELAYDDLQRIRQIYGET
ncbi:hypothetical protein Fmac_003355 [Flemingia macrophylla]|uniref:Peptidase metallopeptidase domain-containing protein n=1 Tax=Flemingia macrophylla TaxID=520843 RepID=A0ABD1NQH6_9FABA